MKGGVKVLDKHREGGTKAAGILDQTVTRKKAFAYEDGAHSSSA